MTLIELLITLSLVALLGTYSLRGWQQQQHRLALDNASMSLLSFLSHVRTVANQRNQTLAIKRQHTATGQWCLWASEKADEQSSKLVDDVCCEATPIHWLLPYTSVQLLDTSNFPPARFHGEQQNASATRWQLQSGPYQIRVVLSSKGRLSRCSEQGNLTSLRRCR